RFEWAHIGRRVQPRRNASFVASQPRGSYPALMHEEGYDGLLAIIPLGERHLRAVVREFVEHYHAERNHQGLGNVIPFPSRDSASALGRVGRRERLGGVLSFYERSAA
ncbi:MAG: hypothetical protein ACLP1X_10325, partial [Polyangiaceae bacterium]